jgi:hypothetical protein
MSERVAIVGSRPPKGANSDYDTLHAWSEQLWTLVKSHVEALPLDTVIISGGARGADRMAVSAARDRGMRCVEYLPDWNRLGKAAGAKRNQQIVDDCDRVIAFWDGYSKGTAITIDMARRAGKPVEIVSIP